RLRVLDLARSLFGGPGVNALAGSPNLAWLRELDLSGNWVGPTGVRALASSPHLGRLRSLSLWNTGSAEGVAALAETRLLGQLHALDLGANHLTDQAVFHLASSPHLRCLRRLSLGESEGIGVALETLRPNLLPLLRCLAVRGSISPAESALRVRFP